MTEEQIKQWGADLLKQQQEDFMKNIPVIQPPAPEPTYSFEDDPEKAVNALLKRQMSAFMEPVQQQIKAMTDQVTKLSQQHDQQAAEFMKLMVPEAQPDEAFDKEPAGFGAMTWGQLRGMAEKNGDVDGLKQYAEALKQFKDSSGDQEVPSARARTQPSPSKDGSTDASEEDVNNDMMLVMNGQMSKDDFNKKYGVAS